MKLRVMWDGENYHDVDSLKQVPVEWRDKVALLLLAAEKDAQHNTYIEGVGICWKPELHDELAWVCLSHEI